MKDRREVDSDLREGGWPQPPFSPGELATYKMPRLRSIVLLIPKLFPHPKGNRREQQPVSNPPYLISAEGSLYQMRFCPLPVSGLVREI
jgi:hypothetical protein